MRCICFLYEIHQQNHQYSKNNLQAKAIVLDKGFIVYPSYGGVFKAEIGGCNWEIVFGLSKYFIEQLNKNQNEKIN